MTDLTEGRITHKPANDNIKKLYKSKSFIHHLVKKHNIINKLIGKCENTDKNKSINNELEFNNIKFSAINSSLMGEVRDQDTSSHIILGILF